MNKAFTFDLDDDGCPDPLEAPSQSPWEFSGYSVTVAEEHLKRRTTSIDHKISQAKLKIRQYQEAKLKTRQNQETSAKGSQTRKRRVQFIGQNGNLHNIVGDFETEEDDAYETKEDESSEAGSVDTSDDENYSGRDVGSEGNAGLYNNFYKVRTGGEAEEDSAEESEETEEGDSGEEGDHTQFQTTKSAMKGPALAQEESKKPTKTAAKFFSSVEGVTFNAKTFMELHISRPLLRACDALGYKQPTPIQAACIPLALTGRDICGSAVTGSGKTAAFALPLLERLLFRPRRVPGIRVLILTPTRELAVQIHSMIEKLAQFTDIRCCLVVGGLSSKVQEAALRSQPDIVIATPGRMIDHLHNTQSVGLEDLAILVLDEADRLLELGFSNEVQELVRLCPKRRQTMLFSATLTEEVNELVKLSLANPVRLSADPSTQRPVTLLEQVIRIRPQHEADKEAVLLALCSRSFTSKAIIFSGTKVEAHRLKILFGLLGLKAAELHGNLTQVQRLDALELFRKKEVDFLIATDVAARGLDIVGVETVINFECPRDITTYVHRVGRTARAGQEGCAITFICEKDHHLVKSVAKRAGSKLSSRVVPAGAIMKWHDKIEGVEEPVHAILQEEKEEKALRKAEMEVNRAQNLIDHESEIFSRPKRIWFQTVKEKRQIANAAKAAKNETGDDGNGIASGNIAKAVKTRTGKRSLEREKNMTRKKRRRLEALREAADGDTQDDEKPSSQVSKKSRDNTPIKQKGSTTLELAYRKAKAVKAFEKARESGKAWTRKLGADKGRSKLPRERTRKVQMQELFQGDLSELKSKNRDPGKGASGNAKRRPGVSKRSFKSKARYKRR